MNQWIFLVLTQINSWSTQSQLNILNKQMIIACR